MYYVITGAVPPNTSTIADSLTIKDLGKVQEEIFEVRAEWYNIGLALGIFSDTLDAIKENDGDVKECFRTTLKECYREVQREAGGP